MLNIADPEEALDLDVALALAAEHAERQALEETAGRADAGPFGMLFALLEKRL